MQKTVTIKKMYVNTESRGGKVFSHPKIAIYFDNDSGKEVCASQFVPLGNPAHDWKEGDKLTLDFVKKGDFLNFSPPKFDPNAKVMAEIEKIWSAIDELKGDRTLKVTKETADEITIDTGGATVETEDVPGVGVDDDFFS